MRVRAASILRCRAVPRAVAPAAPLSWRLLRLAGPRHVPIGVRLFGAFVVVLLLTAGVALLSVRRLEQVTDSMAALVEKRIRAAEIVSKAWGRVDRLEHHLLLHGLVAHDSWTDHLVELESIDRAVQATVATYRADIPVEAREAQLLAEMLARYHALSDVTAGVFRLLDAGRRQDAVDAILEDWHARHAGLIAAGERFVEAINLAMRDAAVSANAKALAGRDLIGALAVVGVPATLLLTILITRSVTVPIRRLVKAADLAADGDLQVGAPDPGGDEIAHLARRFDDMIERLGRTFDDQRQFVADVSHELRRPLTIILGEAEVALRGGDKRPGEYADALRTIADTAGGMARLVDDLLFLARPRAGQIPAIVADVDLTATVRAVAEHGRALGVHKNVGIVVGRRDPVFVTGDEGRLRQLLMILLDNAVKYTPAGGSVRVDVSGEHGRAVIDVTDTGIGIPPEHLPFIFERFYRAVARNGDDGLGLGLAIAKRIAHAHRGSIFAESQLGKGSRFSVVLPRSIAA